MAGKPGMHRKVLNQAGIERLRESIKASLIIKKLEDHILDGQEMSSTQVNAALGLLKKKVPDLSAMTLSGDEENPLQLAVIERRVVDVPKTGN